MIIHSPEFEDDENVASWQQRVFLASQVIVTDVGKTSSSSHDDNDDDWFLLNGDNTSRSCPVSLKECACDDLDQPVMVLLRWTKILFLKVARMYSVAPICLALLPMVLGLVIGYWLAGSQKPGINVNAKRDGSGLWGYPRAMSLISVWFWSTILHFPRAAFWFVFQCGFGREALLKKETEIRTTLRSDLESTRESQVDPTLVPRHLAIIMDGNRRYGKAKYGSASKGHYDGSRTLVNMAKWCIAEGIDYLTVYAFSTENWNRHPSEVASLMSLFVKYCDELRIEALERNIQVRVLSTETDRIPKEVRTGLKRMVDDTRDCTGGLTMNICLSYGSRGEVVNVCRSIASEASTGDLRPEQVTERLFSSRLLTTDCPDPDIVLRTSGEYRLSNFLLWQLAYSELFFVDKAWPEIEKQDLIDMIRTFANGRSRRFGK